MLGKISGILLFMLAGIALAAGGDDNPVTIQRIAATYSRHTYDRAHPYAQMPATQPDEAGVTVSDYSCVAEVDGQISDKTITSNDAKVTVKISGVHVTLKLTIAEWMDSLAPQKIWAHEDGHRDIALHFYQNADAVADAVARPWIGKSLTATGADPTAAAKSAASQAAKKITADYMVVVRDRCEMVQEAYDRITQHGTNDVDEYDAIQQALAEVGKKK